MDRMIGKEKAIANEKPLDLRDYILNPEIDPLSWNFYKYQESNQWSAEEFGDKFVNDHQDYMRSNKAVQNLLDGFIVFFIFGDGLIACELVEQIVEVIETKNWPEFFYLVEKLKIENTHAETYSQAFQMIIPKEKHSDLIKMVNTVPCVRRKGEWMAKIIKYNENKALKKVCEAICEGIFFTTQFSMIFFLRKIGMFNNFIESNGQINKDETLHRDEACAKANLLLNRENKEELEIATELIKEGVEIEKEFTDYLMQFPIISVQGDVDAGLTRENVYGYIEKLANDICNMIDIKPIFKVECAVLPWMEDINVSQKDNFYERATVTNYRMFNPADAIERWKRIMDVQVDEEEKEDTFDNVYGVEF